MLIPCLFPVHTRMSSIEDHAVGRPAWPTPPSTSPSTSLPPALPTLGLQLVLHVGRTMADVVFSVVEGNWSSAIKSLDHAIRDSRATGDAEHFALLMNRGFCNLRLQLYRKALKVLHACIRFHNHGSRHGLPTRTQDYEEALTIRGTSSEALFRKGHVLVALKNIEVGAGRGYLLLCFLASTKQHVPRHRMPELAGTKPLPRPAVPRTSSSS